MWERRSWNNWEIQRLGGREGENQEWGEWLQTMILWQGKEKKQSFSSLSLATAVNCWYINQVIRYRKLSSTIFENSNELSRFTLVIYL